MVKSIGDLLTQCRLIWLGHVTGMLDARHLKKLLFDWLSPALKPGRVIQVTFCPGHPGQTRLKNYPNLTRIGSRAKQIN